MEENLTEALDMRRHTTLRARYGDANTGDILRARRRPWSVPRFNGWELIVSFALLFSLSALGCWQIATVALGSDPQIPLSIATTVALCGFLLSLINLEVIASVFDRG